MLNKQDRARQFLPFDALKGLKEALREKEIEYVEKVELSYESKEILSNKLKLIEKSDIINITYYFNRQYKEVKGIVKEISANKQKIILSNDIKINFSDILNINKE